MRSTRYADPCGRSGRLRTHRNQWRLACAVAQMQSSRCYVMSALMSDRGYTATGHTGVTRGQLGSTLLSSRRTRLGAPSGTRIPGNAGVTRGLLHSHTWDLRTADHELITRGVSLQSSECATFAKTAGVATASRPATCPRFARTAPATSPNLPFT